MHVMRRPSSRSSHRWGWARRGGSSWPWSPPFCATALLVTAVASVSSRLQTTVYVSRLALPTDARKEGALPQTGIRGQRRQDNSTLRMLSGTVGADVGIRHVAKRQASQNTPICRREAGGGDRS